MSAPLLVKHVAESRLYAFDFGTWSDPGPRGTVWGQALLGVGDTFAQGLALPLLLESMAGALPAATITVTRSDGQASDLTLGTPRVAGSQVQLALAGGTNGLTYSLTCLMTTQAGNLLAVQGQLLTVATLP